MSTVSWEPLPQRSVSNRAKHRHLRCAAASSSSFACEASIEQETSDSPDAIPPWKRKNTSGCNSYLKVVLGENTLNHLHEMTKHLIEAHDKISSSPSRDDHRSGSTTKRRPLRIKTRSRSSLHMTFFFGGEVICELPTSELLEWHKALEERLARSNFRLKQQQQQQQEQQLQDQQLQQQRSSSASGHDDALRNSPGSIEDTYDEDDTDDAFSFQIRELAIFPPRRNNLIVAILEPSPAWHTLYHDVHELSKNGVDSVGLHEISKKGKDRWTAHITLANLIGGSKEDVRELARVVKQFSEEELAAKQDSAACCVQCISMGGPVPSQVALDWTFEYVVARET